MKKNILIISFIFVLISLVFNSNISASSSTLIDITKCKITNENYIDCIGRDASVVFNNQALLPKDAITLKDVSKLDLTTWQPNYKIEFGVPSFYIDLGAYYTITNIAIFDTYSSPKMSIYQGQPSKWDKIGDISLNGYKSYKMINNDNKKAVRYLRFQSNEIQSGIAEIGIYGYKNYELSTSEIIKTGPKKSLSVKDNLTSGKKIGANTFSDDPYSTLAALGNIREYYSLNWFVDSNNKYNFNNVVNHDNYFKTLKEMNISVIPCVQYTVPTLTGKVDDFEKVRNNKPIAGKDSPLDPLSYKLHSNFMYNFAARYGNNKNINKDTLSVANSSDKVVGLGYLNSVESWNEPNKTWEGVNSYFTPEEFAAMLSADWDGHEGKIVNGGVKKADPNFKLIMGGLWWQGTDDNIINYLDRMKVWFDYNRSDGVFCSDYINVHVGVGKNPEAGDWDEKIKLLQNWIDKNVPGTELWISEFDVDVTDMEIKNLDNHLNEKYNLVRAQRLLRSYLMADKQKVDRMSMFMIRDTSYGAYYNSGLTTEKGIWDKKISWYYVSSAVDTLKNADLVSVKEDSNVYCYKYKDRKTSEIIYAVWSPTSSNKILKNYNLKVGNYGKATLVVPTNEIMEGEKTPLTINSETVTIDVGEDVKFIKVSNEDVKHDNYPQKLINIQELKLGNLNGSIQKLTFSNSEVIKLNEGKNSYTNNFMLSQFYNLFDEQTKKNTPQTPWTIIKKENKPTTEMGALSVHKDREYPYDAIITFDDFYDITYIGLYDTYNVGLMEIYDDNTGKLIYKTNLDTYDYYRMVPMTSNIISTNRIRIVKYNDSKINELSFYGYKTNSKVGTVGKVTKGVMPVVKSEECKKLSVKNINLSTLSTKFTNAQSSILKSFNYLFDEQSKTPNNISEGVQINTKWSTSFTNIWGNGVKFPYDAIINFTETSEISKVGIFLGYGRKDGKIEIYNSYTNELLLSKIIEGTNKWILLDLNKSVKVDNLRIVKYDDKPIYEMSFYGKN